MPSSRRSFLTACTAGLSALAGCVSFERPTADGTWPRRTLNNAHTGHSTNDGPTTGLHTVWHKDQPDDGVSPVVDNGTVYFAYVEETRSDNPAIVWVEALDAATGNSQWKTEIYRTEDIHYLIYAESMVLDGGRIYLQTMDGLTMLDTDGEIKWTFENLLDGQQMPDVVTPIVTDEMLVTGTYNSNNEDYQDELVYGVDPQTGEERWRTTLPTEEDMWQLAGTDETVYVPSHHEALTALDVATGDELWREELPIDGTPTVTDDALVIPVRLGNDEFGIAALDRRDRSVRWQQSIGVRWPDAGLSVADGRIYYMANFGVEARDLETGKRVWRVGGERTEDDGSKPGVPQFDLRSTPVVSGGAVYAPGWLYRDTTYGQLFVLDRETGKVLGRAEMDRNETAKLATPAVTSDLVFLPSNYGDLYAFGECSFGVAGNCLIG